MGRARPSSGTPAPRASGMRVAAEVVVALVTVAAAVLGVTWLVAIPWVVAGPSMSPTLEHGDRVIVDLWSYRRRAPRPGEIALFDGPGELPMVKRVADGPPPGAPRLPAVPLAEPWEETVWVVGDNPPASLDSRQFGAVPRHRFRGRLMWRYWPPSRAGSVR